MHSQRPGERPARWNWEGALTCEHDKVELSLHGCYRGSKVLFRESTTHQRLIAPLSHCAIIFQTIF